MERRSGGTEERVEEEEGGVADLEFRSSPQDLSLPDFDLRDGARRRRNATLGLLDQ